MTTQTSFSAGSDCPALEPGTLRLYSMRFCPFAHRVRLVMAHKNIPHEVVNIDLKNKPDWFLQKTPLGMVPTLEKDKQIVFESPICCDYLDQAYPENKLTPSDPYRQAQDKMLLVFFSRFILDYPKIMQSPEGENTEAVKKIEEHFKGFEIVLKGRQGAYFGGQTLQMLDLMMWPWFERFLIMAKVIPTKCSLESFPLLHQWTVTMSKNPAVTKCFLPLKEFLEFVKSSMTGAPNFDIGLKQES